MVLRPLFRQTRSAGEGATASERMSVLRETSESNVATEMTGRGRRYLGKKPFAQPDGKKMSATKWPTALQMTATVSNCFSVVYLWAEHPQINHGCIRGRVRQTAGARGAAVICCSATMR